jgi:hypothetical protein
MIGTQINADFQDAINSNPPSSSFFKWEKGLMIYRIPVNCLSSLWRPGGISGKAVANHETLTIL